MVNGMVFCFMLSWLYDVVPRFTHKEDATKQIKDEIVSMSFFICGVLFLTSMHLEACLTHLLTK